MVPADAQSTYSITTQGISWSDLRIQINIPATPAVLQGDLLQAIAIWNHEITWFESTYYPLEESYYSFISRPNSTAVSIQPVNLQTLQSICSTSGGITVCTHFTVNLGSGYILDAQVDILASDLVATNPTHLFAVVAALGTLIGLVEYPAPCAFQDLMCASNPTPYPSTLDLYAARVLAGHNRVTTVTLPANIPYQQAPVLPVPEFQGVFPLLAFIEVSSTLILLRSNARRRSTVKSRRCS
jgi:hypothetical protein